MARVAQGSSLPALGGATAMGAPHPPRAGAGSRSARTPRSASQAKGAQNDPKNGAARHRLSLMNNNMARRLTDHHCLKDDRWFG